MPKYKIGARAHDYGRCNPDEIFNQLSMDNWDCTQLAMTKVMDGVNSFKDITPERITQIKNTMKQSSVSVEVLGAYVELSTMNEELRKVAVENFISQLSVCRELNIPCMASETTSITKQPIGTKIQDTQIQLLKSLDAIMAEAEQHNVIVALEPVWHHALNTVETTRMVLDSIKSPNLKIIFDPANLLSEDWIEKQDILYGRAIENFGELIMAVHFKGVCYDRNGRRPCTLEESIVDYQSAFDAMANLPQQILPVLREEAVPSMAAKDQQFMRRYTERM